MRFLTFLAVCLFSISAFAESTKVLFLGDSLTEGYGIALKDAYPQQVKSLLEKEGREIEIINGGQSGATTASSLKRLDWYLRAEPNILLLALGANDGLRSLSSEETQGNLQEIVQRAKAKNIKVILAGMKLPPNYGPEYTKKFEETFSYLAKKEDLAFIPFLLEGVGGEPEYNLPDQIHPNEKGHLKIAQLVAEKIKEVLSASSP